MSKIPAQASLRPTIFARVTGVVEMLSIWRFQVLFLLLLVQAAAFCTQGIWVEDFWEHSAAVNEFIQRPLHPTHPQLSLSAPHPFLNPYAFVVAQFARLVHLDAINALALFGVLNFCLFCYGLRAFIASLLITSRNALTEHEQKRNAIQHDHIAFYALLFILFLWGGKPWPYSGFFHYQILLMNLPYPSTFVGGLCLLGLAFNARHQYERSYTYLIVLIAITSVSLLTHPLTTQFLLIGYVAQLFSPQPTAPNEADHRSPLLLRLLKISFISGVSLALATLWPFYPILELFRGAGGVYDISNGDMYFHLLTRVWPFIVLAPLYLWIMTQSAQRPLLIIFIVTLAIYAYGYTSERYSFGRIISFSILCIHLACAVAAFRVEGWLLSRLAVVTRCSQLALCLVLLVYFAGSLHASVQRLLTAANSVWLGRTISNQITYKEYLFLFDKVEAGAVVFGNIEVSWVIPSFGPKVVAVDHSLAFVDDFQQRQQDVFTFFRPNTSLILRQALLAKYNAQYLLLNKKLDRNWANIRQQFSSQQSNTGSIETDAFVLIALTAK